MSRGKGEGLDPQCITDEQGERSGCVDKTQWSRVYKYGHGVIGYPKGRNVERALGPSCPCVLCISHSLGLYLLDQV